MKRTWLVLPLAMALAAVGGFIAAMHHFGLGAPDDQTLQESVQSRRLGGLRPYRVHLPESYGRETRRRYPVVFVLDGSSQDEHTAASAALMARIGVTPEVIVVGIPSVDDETRQRDYTPPGMRQDVEVADSPGGQADRFLAFLREELIPEVDRRFRTSTTRVLAGNSRGGLFVVYALSAEPSLFQGYVANSPALWRDDDAMVAGLQASFRTRRTPPARLFLSLGGNENEKMRRAYSHALRVLAADAPASLRWHAQLTPGAVHADNAALATPAGLRWVFDPAWIPPGAD